MLFSIGTGKESSIFELSDFIQASENDIVMEDLCRKKSTESGEGQSNVSWHFLFIASMLKMKGNLFC